jgi:hypothetical protein
MLIESMTRLFFVKQRSSNQQIEVESSVKPGTAAAEGKIPRSQFAPGRATLPP